MKKYILILLVIAVCVLTAFSIPDSWEKYMFWIGITNYIIGVWRLAAMFKKKSVSVDPDKNWLKLVCCISWPVIAALALYKQLTEKPNVQVSDTTGDAMKGHS